MELKLSEVVGGQPKESAFNRTAYGIEGDEKLDMLEEIVELLIAPLMELKVDVVED